MLLRSFLSFLLLSTTCYSEPQETPPTLLTIDADTLTYNQPQDCFEASGSVLLKQWSDNRSKSAKRSLKADHIIYHRILGEIIAQGKIFLTDDEGVVTADWCSTSDDFKTIRTEAFQLDFTDQSYFKASKGYRYNDKTLIQEGTYTPCYVCTMGESPLWQIRSKTIKHDRDQKKIMYRDAYLDIKGVPIAYAPYFFHADPTVKRKTGLLTPSVGMSKGFGGTLHLPTYITLGQHRDLIIRPIVFTRQNPVLYSQYRHRFYNGFVRIEASGTNVRNVTQHFPGTSNPRRNRWNLASTLDYHPSDHYRVLLDIDRASDVTYLLKYPIRRSMLSAFSVPRNLTSQARMESFYPHSYGRISAYAFQTADQHITPFVLPSFSYAHQSPPGSYHQIWELQANFRALKRKYPIPGVVGTQYYRMSEQALGSLPLRYKGHKVVGTVILRSDQYVIERFQAINRPISSRKNIVRVIPQGSIDWSYPIFHQNQDIHWIIGPRSSLIGMPKIRQKDIPNEDSQLFAFDNTNMFCINRFGGFDRVEDGSRWVYGLDQTLSFVQQRSIRIFIGQSRRLSSKPLTLPNSSLESKNPENFLHTEARLHQNFALRYRSYFSNPKPYTKFSELGALIGPKWLHLDTAYVYTNKQEAFADKKISQLIGQLRSQFHDYWSISIAEVLNLKRQENVKHLARFGTIQYRDECFEMNFGVYKTEQRYRDVRPDTGFLIQITLRNLGTITPITTASYPGSLLYNIPR